MPISNQHINQNATTFNVVNTYQNSGHTFPILSLLIITYVSLFDHKFMYIIFNFISFSQLSKFLYKHYQYKCLGYLILLLFPTTGLQFKTTQFIPQEGNGNRLIKKIFQFFDFNEDFLEPSSRNIVQVDRSWSNIDPLHHTGILLSTLLIHVVIRFFEY